MQQKNPSQNQLNDQIQNKLNPKKITSPKPFMSMTAAFSALGDKFQNQENKSP